MKTVLKVVAGVLIAFVLLIGGCAVLIGSSAGEISKEIDQSVIDDYNTAKEVGTKIDICISAGSVKWYFININDEVRGKKWAAVEKKDCAAAGIPITE